MKKLRWQLIIIFLTGLVVGVLLLGEQPEPQQVFSTPEPEKGGAYSEALVGTMQRLNPLLDYGNPVDRDVNRLIFSSLLRFDSRGNPQPELAETGPGVSKDGTIYNISLKKGIKWHDGRPLTSSDVLYTLDLIRQGGEPIPADLTAFWNEVDVSALSDEALQFKLPEAFAPFPDYLVFGILPRHATAANNMGDLVKSPFNLKPIGSGPYQFDFFVSDAGKVTGVALSAFEDYYGKKPFIQKVVFRYYADSAAALKAYNDGVVQGIGNVTRDILKDVLATSSLAVYSGRWPELGIILLNHRNPETPFLKEPDIRKALMTGLNRQAIINKIWNGQAILADGPIFPGTWAYYDPGTRFDFDAEKAKNMLKDAGYLPAAEKDGPRKKGDTQLVFELAYPDDPTSKLVAEMIQKDWAALGVKVTLAPSPIDKLMQDKLDQRAYQAALVSLNFQNSPDPDPYPYWDQAQATGGQNYTQWDNRMASEYIEQARTIPSLVEREKMYRNFQIIYAQELPALPLYYPVFTFAVDRQIQGVRMGPLFQQSDRLANFTEWSVVTKKPVQQTPVITPTR